MHQVVTKLILYFGTSTDKKDKSCPRDIYAIYSNATSELDNLGATEARMKAELEGAKNIPTHFSYPMAPGIQEKLLTGLRENQFVGRFMPGFCCTPIFLGFYSWALRGQVCQACGIWVTSPLPHSATWSTAVASAKVWFLSGLRGDPSMELGDLGSNV